MKPFVAQWIAALTANLGILSGGMHHGWSSPMLPKIFSGEDELQLAKNEASWAVSFLSFGCMLGPILVSVMVDRAGRKRSLILTSLPLLVSWIIVGLATDAATLYIGRFVAGVGLGSNFCLVPMYLGEIADDKIRGALGTLLLTMLNVGMVLAYSAGPWVSRQILSIIALGPIVIFVTLFCFMPESPYFYILKDREEEAEKSLQWLKQKLDVSFELEQIKISVQMQQRNKGSIWELFRAPGSRKAMFVGITLHTYQQCSGVNVIQSYASIIFAESGFAMSGSVSVVIMGATKLLVGATTIFFIDRFGRKPMLIASATSTFCVLMLEAIFFNLKYESVDVTAVSWIPLIGIMAFYMTYTIGMASVPITIATELFPINVKASAGMILTIYTAGVAAIVAKVYQVIETSVGIHVAFYCFAAITITCVPFTYFRVLETKGRSLQNILDTLNAGTANDVNPKQCVQADGRTNI